MRLSIRTLLTLTIVTVTAYGCGARDMKDGELRGSGSTFVAPLMERWIADYAKQNRAAVKYEAIGSGSGVFQMIDQKVDFACSDAVLEEQELLNARATRGEVVHIPLIVSGVVPIYNLCEKGPPARFTGPLLADIYLGKIKKWNDPRLQAIQEPAMTLPDQDILLVHRSDGSGTTHIFTEYLSKTSPEWRDKVGTGTAVKWPAGIGQNGNKGVAEHVKRTPGAIGYVTLEYAMSDEHQFGAVQNRAGEFLQAGQISVSAALETATIPDDLRFSLTDSTGRGAYPICGTTWAIVYVHPSRNAREIVAFLRWVLHEGQKSAPDLNYTPVPPELSDRAEQKLALIVVK